MTKKTKEQVVWGKAYNKFIELLKEKYIPDEMQIEFSRIARDGASVKAIKNLLDSYREWYDVPNYSFIEDDNVYLIDAYETKELTLGEMNKLWEYFQGETWTEELERDKRR